jgi:hypothetical protein
MMLIKPRHDAFRLRVLEPFHQKPELLFAESFMNVADKVQVGRLDLETFHDQGTRLLVDVGANRREDVRMLADFPQHFEAIKCDRH